MASDWQPIAGAPSGGRRLLGVLLAQRRMELGYAHHPAMARARIPLTGDGNPNTRMLADLEHARRDNFPEPRLRQLARAYEVTYQSVTDVAWQRATSLQRAPAGAELPDAPITDPDREAAIRPWLLPIWKAILEAADRGIRDPSSAQLGLDPDDALVWDGSRGAMSREDRAWLVAEIRRRRLRTRAAAEAGHSALPARTLVTGCRQPLASCTCSGYDKYGDCHAVISLPGDGPGLAYPLSGGPSACPREGRTLAEPARIGGDPPAEPESGGWTAVPRALMACGAAATAAVQEIARRPGDQAAADVARACVAALEVATGVARGALYTECEIDALVAERVTAELAARNTRRLRRVR